MLGGPFERVGKIADRVKVAGTLWRQAQKPADKRAKATQIMCLMEDGDVDSKHYEHCRPPKHPRLQAAVQPAPLLARRTLSPSRVSVAGAAAKNDVHPKIALIHARS